MKNERCDMTRRTWDAVTGRIRRYVSNGTHWTIYYLFTTFPFDLTRTRLWPVRANRFDDIIVRFFFRVCFSSTQCHGARPFYGPGNFAKIWKTGCSPRNGDSIRVHSYTTLGPFVTDGSECAVCKTQRGPELGKRYRFQAIGFLFFITYNVRRSRWSTVYFRR